MVLNRQDYNKENILDIETFKKVLDVEDIEKQSQLENQLLEIATELRVKSKFEQSYRKFKRQYLIEKSESNKIYFGEKADFPFLLSGHYYKNAKDQIFNEKGERICSQLIQPVAIYINKEKETEFVKCKFLRFGIWKSFIVEKSTLFNQGKIIRLSDKGVDVSSVNAFKLLKYLQEMLNLNEQFLPKYPSTSKMGWNGDKFIPYDDDLFFDGDDNFRQAFNSLKQHGNFDLWKTEMLSIRKNKIIRLLHATSLASVLLHKLKMQSFVTMLWGNTGDGKTVAGMTAMSFWGCPQKGSLMYSLNNTDNFYYRIAEFFNHLPVFFDELQTYKGNIDKLIMNITEGVDRGKAKIDGGVEPNRYWNNAFIMTGEQTASSFNSGRRYLKSFD